MSNINNQLFKNKINEKNIPKFRKKLWKDKRKRERGNYIVHPTPLNTNRFEWHNAYISQLVDFRNIVFTTIQERYPKNKIKWNTNEYIVHNLSKLIYHCSSKYISEYLEYFDEMEYKELKSQSKHG